MRWSHLDAWYQVLFWLGAFVLAKVLDAVCDSSTPWQPRLTTVVYGLAMLCAIARTFMVVWSHERWLRDREAVLDDLTTKARQRAVELELSRHHASSDPLDRE
jgi:hypothetical protein